MRKRALSLTAAVLCLLSIFTNFYLSGSRSSQSLNSITDANENKGSRSLEGGLALEPATKEYPAVAAAVSVSNYFFHWAGTNSMLHFHKQNSDLPGWSIKHGKEFWRQGRLKDKAEASRFGIPVSQAISAIDFDELIERVDHAFEAARSDTEARVNSVTYTACVGTEGLKFSPRASEVSNPGVTASHEYESAELRLKTASIWRGEKQIYDHSEVAPDRFVLGNVAQSLLNEKESVVEHFEASQDGVAATWILNKPIPGNGNLLIEAKVTGLDYIAETRDGFHYADKSGTARVQIGLVLAVDALKRTWPLVAQVSENNIRINVSADILEQAQYPLAIDPLLSAEFGIQEPLTRDDQSHFPAIAFNGEHYLVVWYAGELVRGTLVKPNGEVKFPTSFVISRKFFLGEDSYRRYRPVVSSDNKNFMVAWIRSATQIAGCMIADDGSIIKREFLISDRPTSFDGMYDSPALTFGNDRYVVMANYFYREFQIRTNLVAASFVARDGSVLQTSTLSKGSYVAGRQCVVENGTNFFVVGTRYPEDGSFASEVIGFVLSPSGSILASNSIATHWKYLQDAQVAVGVNGYLISWRRSDTQHYATSADLLASRVGFDLTVRDQGGFLICKNQGGDIRPALTKIGNEFMVAWSITNFWGVRITLADGVRDPEPISLWDARMPQRLPAIASDGTNLFIVRDDGKANIVDLDGRRLVSEPVQIAKKTIVPNSLAVASNGRQFLCVWEASEEIGQYLTKLLGLRISTDGELLDPNGIIIASGRVLGGSLSVASDGESFLVGDVLSEVFYRRDALGLFQILGDGTVIKRSEFRLPKHPDSYRFESLNIASNGRGYLATWDLSEVENRNVYASQLQGMRITPDLQLGPVFSVAPVLRRWSSFSQTHRLVSDGTNCLAVWIAPAGEKNGTLGTTLFTSNSFENCSFEPAIPATQLMTIVLRRGGYLLHFVQPGQSVPWDSHYSFASISADGKQVERVHELERFLLDVSHESLLVSDGTNVLYVVPDSSKILVTPLSRYGSPSGGGILLREKEPFPIGFYSESPAMSASYAAGRFMFVYPFYKDLEIKIASKLLSLVNPINIDADGVRVSWPISGGKAYRVQYNSHLNPASWIDLKKAPTIDGGVAFIIDDLPTGSSQRFYRILETKMEP